jgi:hypothetical protein
MRKRGQGAPLYPGSSGKGKPRAVERTTWLGRRPTATVSRIFGWLKTRWAFWRMGVPHPPRHLTPNPALCQQHGTRSFTFFLFAVLGPSSRYAPLLHALPTHTQAHRTSKERPKTHRTSLPKNLFKGLSWMLLVLIAGLVAAKSGHVPTATFPPHLVGNVSAVTALLERVLPGSSAHFELSITASCPGVPAGKACFTLADSADGKHVVITGTSASELTGGLGIYLRQ